MTFGAAIRACFGKYMTFSGRARRAEFWKFTFFCLLMSIILVFINGMIFGPTITESVRTLVDASGQQSVQRQIHTKYDGGWLGLLFSLAVIVPTLAVTSRRLHDTNRRGWWMLFPVVTIFVSSATSVILTVGWSTLVEALATTGQIHINNPVGWPFLLIVAFGSAILLLVWLCQNSNDGPNRFGSNPKEVPQ